MSTLKKLIVRSVLLAFLLAYFNNAYAWYIYPNTLSEAIDKAQLIFLGKVISTVSSSAIEDEYQYSFTCYSLEVRNVFKGRITSPEMTLRVPGGIVDDLPKGQLQKVAVGPFPLGYQPGESFLIFMGEHHSDFMPIIPFYHYGIELVEFSDQPLESFFSIGYGPQSEVIMGIRDNNFEFSNRNITKALERPNKPRDYVYAYELIKLSEPITPATTIVTQLQTLIAERKEQSTYIPGGIFSASSVEDLAEWYTPSSYARYKNLQGCGEKYPR